MCAYRSCHTLTYMSKRILKGTCALRNSKQGQGVHSGQDFIFIPVPQPWLWNSIFALKSFLHHHPSQNLQALSAGGIVFNIAKLFRNVLNTRVLW